MKKPEVIRYFRAFGFGVAAPDKGGATGRRPLDFGLAVFCCRRSILDNLSAFPDKGGTTSCGFAEACGLSEVLGFTEPRSVEVPPLPTKAGLPVEDIVKLAS